MTLVEAYNQIHATLRPQVQGTCGLYSFYNAVQILRQITPTLPNVPTPKKCETAGQIPMSLRQYAKREFKSGQGEILSEPEMIAFIKAGGYKPLTCGKDDDRSKTDFFTIQTRAGHPVMVAYLAGNAPSGVIPVPNAASGQEGGHWSLVLATHGGNASVVEPNAPNALKILKLGSNQCPAPGLGTRICRELGRH